MYLIQDFNTPQILAEPWIARPHVILIYFYL